MSNFSSRLILSISLCFAPVTFAHPGHGPHAASHWMEMSAAVAGAGIGIGMVMAGALLYAIGYLLGRAWRPHAARVTRIMGTVLGGGGLWFLLG